MALRAAQYKRSKTASRQFLGHPQFGLNIGMRPIGRKRQWPHRGQKTEYLHWEVSVNSASLGYFLASSFT